MSSTAGATLEPLAFLGQPEIAGRTPLRLFWQRIREDRVALAGLAFIVLEVVVAFLAPWIVQVLGHPPNAVRPGPARRS